MPISSQPEALLRWEAGPYGVLTAYRGSLYAGSVIPRDDGVVVYNVLGIDVKWITKGRGEVKSVRTAKMAVERAWLEWMKRADMAVVERSEP